MSRHLVTGAAGVIGFDLAQRLLRAGHEVVAVDMGLKGGLEDLDRLDVEHPGQVTVLHTDLARSTEGIEGRFDGIFHFAAIVGVRYVTDHPYETMVVNMRSALNVLDHAIEHGCGTFVFASSSENYASGVDAGQVPVPTPEDVTLSIGDIALPRWSYAASKMAGESAVFGAAPLACDGGFTPVVVRFHNVYGPRMGPTHVIPEMMKRCREGVSPFPIFGSEQTRSFLFVDDTAQALELVLGAGLAGQGGLYNIGSSRETRIGDLARAIFKVSGHAAPLDEQPAPPGSVRRRVPDVSKLEALGFAPSTSLEDGLAICWALQE